MAKPNNLMRTLVPPEKRVEILRRFLGPRSMVRIQAGWTQQEQRYFAELPVTPETQGWDAQIGFHGRYFDISVIEVSSRGTNRKMFLAARILASGAIEHLVYRDAELIDETSPPRFWWEETWVDGGNPFYGGLETALMDSILGSLDRDGREFRENHGSGRGK